MPAPLVGIAVAAAARLAAKKVAQEAAKRAAKTAATRARSNSAAAAKAVAPKNPSITASKMKMAKTANARRKFDAASQKRILDNQAKKSVKVKPASKQVGNPPNLARAESRQIESVARAGGVKGPLGKKRDTRVFNSKKPTANRTRSGNKAK